MNLINNINLLRTRFPNLWRTIDLAEENLDSRINVLASLTGTPTLVCKEENREIYVHSKYDPYKEAEQIIQQYPVEGYEHVLFYGLGLGYHVEVFLKKHPQFVVSLYEPNLSIFKTFLAHRALDDFPVAKLKNIFCENAENTLSTNIENFIQEVDLKKVLIITLPSYARIFPQSHSEFLAMVKNKLTHKKAALAVNVSFEKRWITNSLLNLTEVMNSPNILHDVDKDYFQGKPALLVAAGPSLQFDIENVRYIKENGLAYVFSVGSAINALLANHIYPDAACTYDPSVLNQKVFEKVIAEKIKEVPLIFGSSVGYETLQNYLGKKLHMLTSQDTVAPFFLRHAKEKRLENVLDAPSIAVVTLQLLFKLGFNPIILAGQNLAYLDNKRYAQGIAYDFIANELSEKEQSQLLEVEDVKGNIILTQQGFNRMRLDLERWIQAMAGSLEVINTTQGGARIAGTKFISLAEVIEGYLTEKVVDNRWLDAIPAYDSDYFKQQLRKANEAYARLSQHFKAVERILADLTELVNQNREDDIRGTFPKFDRAMQKLKQNSFYRLLLQPMNRVSYEVLAKRITEVKFEDNQVKKAVTIIKEFSNYIERCKQDYKEMDQVLSQLIFK